MSRGPGKTDGPASVLQAAVEAVKGRRGLDRAFDRRSRQVFYDAFVAGLRQHIGETVNELLEECGLTQAGIARRVGLNQSTVSRMTQGKFTFENLALLVRALGLDFADAAREAARCWRLAASAAYLAALRDIKERLDGSAGELSPAQLECLRRLVPRWRPGAAGNAQLAETIAREAGLPPGAADRVAEFDKLQQEWGDAWLLCVGAIPAKRGREGT
jgi:predicted XRE-type DNA-binding protein